MKSAILTTLLSCVLVHQAQSNHYNQSHTKSETESSEYQEKTDLSDTYSGHSQEDYPIENNIQEEIDYEVEPRNPFRPVIPYDDQDYRETPVKPYVRKYQPYFLPSEQMESLAPKPGVNPIMENHIKQQPVYANLYWRKIIYPFHTYPTHNSNDNILISENNSPELQTGESNQINRRYTHSPNRGYYRKRNRYPVMNSIVGASHRPQMAFYPISVQSPRMQSKVRYYKTAPNYHRRRKVRPIKPNYKNSPYFYVNKYDNNYQ